MLYEVMHGVVPPLMRAVWRPRIVGLEHVPDRGGVILASNHLSFIDSIAIPSVVKRKVVFLTKSDYFTGTGPKGFVSRAFFEGLGMLPVDRDDSKAAIESLQTALEVLGRGEAFGIYPEGTRSRDGRLYRGRTGVAHLALTAGVPVVPVGLTGTENVLAPRLQPDCGSSRSPSSSGSRSTSPAASTACRSAAPAARSPTRSWRPSRRSPARTRPASTTSAERRTSALSVAIAVKLHQPNSTPTAPSTP